MRSTRLLRNRDNLTERRRTFVLEVDAGRSKPLPYKADVERRRVSRVMSSSSSV